MVIGRLRCTDVFFNSQLTTIDGVGKSWSNVHLRGWHGFTEDRPYCVGANINVAYAQRCDYSNYSQKWAKI
ncbi:hypothetical protein [Streptomyces sp. NPDC007369]|uniref:hypothetical protein n=1 Tax=Streptomyces sp. NPDC007369 TaxID=3154589 RepID=UPI003409F5EF